MVADKSGSFLTYLKDAESALSEFAYIKNISDGTNLTLTTSPDDEEARYNALIELAVKLDIIGEEGIQTYKIREQSHPFDPKTLLMKEEAKNLRLRQIKESLGSKRLDQKKSRIRYLRNKRNSRTLYRLAESKVLSAEAGSEDAGNETLLQFIKKIRN